MTIIMIIRRSNQEEEGLEPDHKCKVLPACNLVFVKPKVVDHQSTITFKVEGIIWWVHWSELPLVFYYFSQTTKTKKETMNQCSKMKIHQIWILAPKMILNRIVSQFFLWLHEIPPLDSALSSTFSRKSLLDKTILVSDYKIRKNGF